jgi:DNA-binding PadR family transcriptional regulator
MNAVQAQAQAGVTTLGYALLGVLARAPSSGYSVAQQMKRPVGFFWHARHSQIYPALAALEAAGLVRHTVVPQRDRPAKKVYAVTDAGRAALRAWVTAPLDAPLVRDELVLRAYCVWQADPAAARMLFERHAALHEAQLAQYEAYRQQMETAAGDALPGAATPEFATYAALRRGIGYEREYAAWCRWLAAALA